jgi:hypothetical protein
MFVQTPGIITELPRMLLSDDATEVLGASCYLVASATNTLIIVLILIAFSLSAMTKSIWQFINIIQILAYMRWLVDWPANAELGFKCLEYSISGRLQTDLLWNIYEKYAYDEGYFRKPLDEFNKYPDFVDEQNNLAKALGVYPLLLILILIAMLYTFILK